MAGVVLIDTGPLVAMLDRREEHHAWATHRSAQMEMPVWTCGAVLTETCFLLREQRPAIARLRSLVQRGTIASIEENAALWSRGLALMERYANVPMSFADACLMAMAEERPRAKLFTLDRDFLIYRGEDDKPLALIAPFAA